LKALFVRLFGILLALCPDVVMAWAFRTPHRHIHDRDGSLYMGRWRVVDEGTFGSRLLRFFTGYSSVRMHHIMRPDHDRALHNHPFTYRTFIMRGWYDEERQRGRYGMVRDHAHGPGDSSHLTPQHYHRISSVSPGGVWTLFFMTPNTSLWGFNVNGQHLDSVRYLLLNGYKRESVKEVQTP
jgi:hypothetical protein